MDETKYNKLVEKLSRFIPHDDGVQPYVSPTPRVPGGARKDPSGTLIVTKDTKLEDYTESQLYMIHTNLHRFYPKGANDLTKEDIEKLHTEIRDKITHSNFDQLDKNDR